MKLEFTGHETRLQHLNIRTEQHGPDEVTALDLKLQLDTGNEALLQFHQRLRGAMFEPPPPAQEPVEGVDPGLPVRAFPDLAPLQWKGEQACSLVLHHAGAEGSDIVLPACKADGFTLELLDGGTVRLGFRVRCTCTDERILGRLPLLLHRVVPMSLLPHEGGGAGGKRKRRGKRGADENQGELVEA